MKDIANLLFEAKMLKETPRSGYHFLGAGKESVAEHSFMITFIAYIMTQMMPEINALKLITMCLLHDLPEARISDLNYVHKKYVTPHEDKAVEEFTKRIPFGIGMTELIKEFNAGISAEAKLANDADQLALILELKSLLDVGYAPPKKWLPSVISRLKTDTGKEIADGIMETESDEWWLQLFQK